MNEIKIREYCLSLPEATEDFPFGSDIKVFKIKNKMFGLMLKQQGEMRINLKCDPDEALDLRKIYPAILPGYHMNKKHWNTLTLNGSVPISEIENMIDNSYNLVVNSLKKRDKVSLEKKYGKTYFENEFL